MNRLRSITACTVLLLLANVSAQTIDIRVGLSSGELPDYCVVAEGEWAVKDGELRQMDDTEHPAKLFFAVPMLSDFELSARFRIAPTRRSVRSADFLFRAADTANYAYFHCNSDMDMVAFARSTDDAYWTIPKRHRSVGVTAGEWHTARITGKGGTFVFHLDGKEVASAVYGELGAGCVGLGSCSAQVAFEDIRLRGTLAPSDSRFRRGSSRHVPVASGPETGTPAWSPSLLRLEDGALLLAYSTAVEGEAPAPGNVLATRSTDGGLNWTPPAAVATVPADERSPRLRTDGEAVVCTWATADGKSGQARSRDGGRSWNPFEGPADGADRPMTEPWVTDDRGRLTIDPDLRVRRLLAKGNRSVASRELLWPGTEPSLTRCANGDVLLLLNCRDRGSHVLRSSDFGLTWQGPIVLCTDGCGATSAAELADGSVLVAHGRSKSRSLVVSRLDVRGPQIVPIQVGTALQEAVVGLPVARNGAMVVAPAMARVNPRNTEGSIVTLRDGRLLLAYTRFYGGGSDHAFADISGMLSEDKGRTWGRPFLIQRNDAGCNVMSASFLRLQTGEILLGYLRKNAPRTDCRFYVRRSTDEGRTWGAEVCATPEPVEYYVVNNDRVIQLRTGRLVVPAADHADWSRRKQAWAVCYLSDDEGKTWRRGKGHVELPRCGCQEPGVVELKDGRLYMIIRNSLGSVYKATSGDGGDTWSEATSTGLPAPVAPSTIKRIPSTGDLLLLWNHSKNRRVPLTAAVSSDDGETWHHIRDIETDGGSFAYTSACFVDQTAVLSYWCSHNGLSLAVRRLPIQWFYGSE